MAYTDIDKPIDYFNTKLYTGNGSTQSITGVGFQPDWTWIKERDDTPDHKLIDSVRGVTKVIESNTTEAESTLTTGITSFDSGGFSLGANGSTNGSGDLFVSWNWLASNTTASNTDGSITSTVSANTTSGFSIVSYTGTGSNATIGHGLGVVPKMILVKRTDSGGDWTSFHEPLGNTKFLRLNSDIAAGTQSTYWQDTDPTSSVFSIGSAGDVNTSSGTHIAYCFAEKKGYSKFGSYTGNGNADGPFVYTGFLPSFVMTKRTTDGNESWHIFDNKRNTFNEVNTRIQANSSGGEDTAAPLGDFVSNGFKIKGTGGGINVSGKNFIYMAFASSPFVTSTGVPTTAR